MENEDDSSDILEIDESSDTFRIAIVAHLKNGALYEAIKKREWTQRETAKFLGINQQQMSNILNMKGRPPFLFPERRTSQYKKRAKQFSEKLMLLTGKSVEDLFPI